MVEFRGFKKCLLDQLIKERLSSKFEESKRWKVDGKFMSGIILSRYNCNDGGKKHSGKWWGFKLRICY